MTTNKITLSYNEKYYLYLDELRESGVTNMFGASPYLQKQFRMDRKVANDVLKDWMDTFAERHCVVD